MDYTSLDMWLSQHCCDVHMYILLTRPMHTKIIYSSCAHTVHTKHLYCITLFFCTPQMQNHDNLQSPHSNKTMFYFSLSLSLSHLTCYNTCLIIHVQLTSWSYSYMHTYVAKFIMKCTPISRLFLLASRCFKMYVHSWNRDQLLFSLHFTIYHLQPLKKSHSSVHYIIGVMIQRALLSIYIYIKVKLTCYCWRALFSKVVGKVVGSIHDDKRDHQKTEQSHEFSR